MTATRQPTAEPFEFTTEQKAAIAAGVVQLSKRKGEQAKANYAAGEATAGAIVMGNQKALDDGWPDAIVALERGEPSAQQLEWLRDSAAIIVHNMRAAGGTLFALGGEWKDVGTKAKETADRLGGEFSRLIPAPPSGDPRQLKMKLERGGKSPEEKVGRGAKGESVSRRKGRGGKDAASGEGAGEREGAPLESDPQRLKAAAEAEALDEAD